MNIRSIAALASIVALASTAPALAFSGQQYAAKAKVTLAQARSTALHAVHGTIVSQELEPEKGGSGLRYTFDVKTAAGVREVGVDAKTGAILENAPEEQGD